MVIGFWNLNDKKLSDTLIDFVNEQQIDILVLAEADDKVINDFILKSKSFRQFFKISNNTSKLSLLSSYSATVFTNKSHLYDSNRWLSYLVEIPSVITFNLISVHFPSKINWAKESLAFECVNFSKDISIVENNSNCYDTILIGDFNMNPFEDGMIATSGINALQDLNYITKRPLGRKINKTSYKYFYNPMWNFFGDFKKPLGTHYCRLAGHVSQEWNIYDQVIFRGSIKQYIDVVDLKNCDYVKIIEIINGEMLTKTHNRPDKKNYSDHLPIIFKLKV